MQLTYAALVALMAVAAVGATDYPSNVGTVYQSGSDFKIVLGKLDPTGVAMANFTDQTLHVSGFGELTIETNSDYFDADQAYAAGYAEGALTAARIVDHSANMHDWLSKNFKDGQVPQSIYDWFATNNDWVRAQVAANPSSGLWLTVGTILRQFDGLVAGYAANKPAGAPELSVDRFYELNAIGDLLDLIHVVDATTLPDWDRMSPEEIMAQVNKRSMCSGFVHVTGNYSELLTAHSSWFTYQSMLRIYKHYNLQYKTSDAATKRLSFSSYPGMLSSLDDFYMMHDQKMVMVQTTNSIFNDALYKQVKPQSLMAWHRVRAACQWTTNGEDWSKVIATYNSGTYNNQYMVTDFKLFTPLSALKAGTLYVSEQIPGLVQYGDMTQTLERGYWPSYNVPYFPEVYNRSGYPEFIERHSHGSDSIKYGALSGLNYQMAPRAKIFRRQSETATDIEGLKNLMRFNEYKTDPYAQGNPWAAICSRGDLASPGQDGGCYDTKVTSSKYIDSRTAQVINGPTRNNGVLPAFSWAEFPSTMHQGMPEVFDFDFEEVTPNFSV